MATNAFVAYPSSPADLVAAIRAAVGLANKAWGDDAVHGWEENLVASRFVTDPIFSEIQRRELLIADITVVNFNVTYEIGYAIGQRKSFRLIINGSLQGDEKLRRDIGIFTTLGFQRYANHDELYDIILAAEHLTPLNVDFPLNKLAPIYYLGTSNQSGALLHIYARLKKTKYRLREFNPHEQPWLNASEAIEHVASSAAVVVPLLSEHQIGWQVHNIRAAFVIGLAHGLGVRCLALQSADGPVPLDVRDAVKTYRSNQQIEEHIADVLPAIVEKVYGDIAPIILSQDILSRTDIGEAMAENETGTLRNYFLQTSEYQSVLRGNVRLVLGRKGSGKTALFMQARDRWKPGKANVVVDLAPENYRLLKLRDAVTAYLAEGSREELLTAMWEYLLLLEIVSKIIDEDYELHLRDHELVGPYQDLARQYKDGDYAEGADFSERLVNLIDRLVERYENRYGTSAQRQLSSKQVLELLYEHDMKALRGALSNYLEHKDVVVVLFDNLDKGWASQGLKPEDVVIIRALVSASDRVVKYLQRAGDEAFVTIFLRNDVYEFLVDLTPDRGKHSNVSIDWRDTQQLKLMVRNRLQASKIAEAKEFETLWHLICEPHIHGEPSFAYMTDRCLMRPRYLLRMIKACRTKAINRQHARIEAEDIDSGIYEFSNELLRETDLEIRDVIPEAADTMVRFVGEPRLMGRPKLFSLFPIGCQSEENRERLLDLLLWFGVLGLQSGEEEPVYIYSPAAGYSLKKLKALVAKSANALFRINPAFELGLGVTSG